MHLVLGPLAALCIWISWEDFRQMRIPDSLNLALGILGLAHLAHALQAWQQVAAQLVFAAAVAGAATGFRWLHGQRSGRVGLGLGDVKMMGAAAIWVAPAQFPLFLLIASVSALVFVSVKGLVRENVTRESRIPFGPFLALALVITWSIQEQLW